MKVLSQQSMDDLLIPKKRFSTKSNTSEIHSNKDNDEFDMNKIRNTLGTGAKYPSLILSLDGSPLIFPHTINLIQGSYGVNKSYLAAYFASAFLNPQLSYIPLKITTNNKLKYCINYLDTEKSVRDQLPAAMSEIIKNAGLIRKIRQQILIPDQ